MKVVVATQGTTVNFGGLYKVKMENVEVEVDLAQLPELIAFARKLTAQIEAAQWLEPTE
jgi:hypothetical protein